MSADLPFVLKGGNDEQTALHNRIAAIERINFLSGIDMRKKSAAYLKAFDLEMWVRWYKNEPADKKIDEEWCQRAAEVIKAMEESSIKPSTKGYTAALKEHQEKLENDHGSQHVEVSAGNVGEAKQV
ncbi:MAG: hypothetical protein WC750_05955 [Patescibacteria group bacterium]|jgi:hypothetical protein